jgi:hypothetical protein
MHDLCGVQTGIKVISNFKHQHNLFQASNIKIISFVKQTDACKR